ncbi:MAG: helix-hairpin-helix domain-containing protein [Bacteroidetes bacterium]|nr:helix-hairpin-helix domain-containing protein [Bacteroidota bacterium]
MMRLIPCKIFLLFFVIILFQNNLFSQADSLQINIQEIIDELLQEPSTEVDNSDLYEKIEDLLNNPIDLNKANITDFQQIPTIDFLTAKEIINYRNNVRKFKYKGDIFLIKSLTNEQKKRIFPFVTVKRKKEQTIKKEKINEPFYKAQFKIRSRIISDLQTRKGFIDGKFSGSKPKIYNRLLGTYSNYSIGILIEKDPGEKSINDLNTFFIQAKDNGYLTNLIVGDYTLEFGQGLALWSPYGFVKGADAIYPVKKKNRNIKPYKSANENNFFRGVAATINFSPYRLSAFYSSNKFDANIDSVTNEIISAPIDGLHRTTTEIRKRKSAKETFKGIRLDYINNESINAGILYYNANFSNSFLSSSIFDLNGNNFNYFSFYYDIFLKKINIFGESVYNGTSIASIINMQFSISKNFKWVTSVRNYPRNFTNIHGFSFGEKPGTVSNEFGIYNGIKWNSPIGLIDIYYDQFKFPFSTFSNPVSTQGDEFLINLRTKPSRKIETVIRYKIENKEITKKINGTLQIVDRKRQNLRGELIYKASSTLRLRSRFEITNYKISQLGINEFGYLIFQDMRIKPFRNLTITSRIILFNSDSFNSSVYEYEYDLQGILSNVGLSGSGIRWYIVGNYRFTNFLKISLKYAETYKPDEKQLSSGEALLYNNVDNRLSLQLDLIL